MTKSQRKSSTKQGITHRLRVMHKILLLVAMSGALAILLAMASGHLINSQLDAIGEIYQHKLVPLNKLRQIQIRYQELEFSMPAVIAEIYPGTMAGANLEQAYGEIEQVWQEVEPLIDTATYGEELAVYLQGRETFTQLSKKLTKAFYDQDTDTVEELHDEWLDIKPQLFLSLDRMIQQLEDLTRDYYEQRSKLMEKVLWIGVALVFIALGLFVWVSLRITNAITRPVEELSCLMHQVEKTGDFTQRAEILGKDELSQMARSYNKLMSALHASISEANRVLSAMAAGDFQQRVDLSLKGELNQLKDGINATAESLNTTLSVLKSLLGEMVAGRFHVDIDVSVSGSFKEMLDDAVNAMASLDKAIQAINSVMDAVSRGDFTQRVDLSMEGDLDLLRNHVNNSLQALEGAMDETVAIASAQAQGNLSQRIRGEYLGQLKALKDAINHSLSTLSTTVNQITKANRKTDALVEHITQGSHRLSDRSQTQAESVQETAASMEQLTGSVQQNAENAGKTRSLTHEVNEQAKGGSSIATDAMSAMRQITQSSKDIANITALIDSIAFQTNLLALNASVEAARAGEHGRGFSVVAQEVRNLAQRSADAARQIKVLISNSTLKVDEGTELVSRSGVALQDIIESIKHVDILVTEITTASNEQRMGIEQTNAAIAQIDRTTQENASLAAETGRTCDELKTQTEMVKELMGFFRG